jgi:energy-coupling factor transport system ATP-binding protein
MTELILQAVVYEYADGTRGLDGVDLHIRGGQSLALIGANGSGKTTLARHLDGLLRPTRGKVLIDGRDSADLSVARLAGQVGLSFQDPDRQIFKSQVRDEVEFGPRRLGRSDEEAFADAKAALEAVGMADDLGVHPDDLGETQRKLLSIASVLAMQTPVVVLDEPTTGLDTRGIGRVRAVIDQLHGAGRTVIGISHDMHFVAESFDRIVLLDRGRVSLDGTPAAVFGEAAWPALRSSGLEPPDAAVTGARLGLGSTPTEAALVSALMSRTSQAPPASDRLERS